MKRTLDDIAFECKGEIETELKVLKIEKKELDFVEQVLEASEKGVKDYGITILCVHADADDKKYESTRNNKIIPAQKELDAQRENDFCKILVAVIPIQETESWMLADCELLKEEIGTRKTDNELKINRFPEDVANPKEVIEDAIRIARQDCSKRNRKNLVISDLYQIVGCKIELKKLENLPSYQKFKESLREGLKKLNFL